MKKVLVTGGAGFLGSHLCARLVEEGCFVTCVDNLSTGTLGNILSLKEHPRFHFVQHNVCSYMHIEAEEIYNLACPASPIQYQADPVQTIKTNVLGAMNVLQLAKDTGARVLQASTSEVYGDPHMHPQKEEYWGHVNPVGHRSCYDEGKRCAETLFFDYMRQYGVNICVARIFNTYGPHMAADDGRVVSNFIVQALRGDPITMYGKGLQTRSFCYVDDLIEALVRLMRADGVIGPINVGNPCEVSVRELAEIIIDLTGSRSPLVFRPLPSDDPKQRRPDISLAQHQLGWEPKIALQEGLKATISYFKKMIY